MAKTRGLPVFLLFTVCMYVRRDNSIILKTCTLGWRVVRLHVNEGYVFTPPKRVTSPMVPGVPHRHVKSP